MPDFSMSSSNATLTYMANGGSNTAKVRVSRAVYLYGVTSTESHSRLNRAFYPHRRALGQFSITVDAIGYKEHRNFQNWLRGYATALFSGQVGTQKGATTMDVYMPSRNFHKVGILTTGIDDHDHVGSMTFSPVLTFMLLKDFQDPSTAIVNTSSTSQFVAPKMDTTTSIAFYPSSVSSYKDTDSSIYDLKDNTPDVQAVITPPNPNGTIPGGLVGVE